MSGESVVTDVAHESGGLGMTNRGILALAVIATGCLILGARLLDQPSTLTAVLAAVVLEIGRAHV